MKNVRLGFAVCMSKVFFGLLVLISSDQVFAGSAFDHVNTSSFAKGMKDYYVAHMALNIYRNKIIAAAKEECGGRYEGTEIKVTEISHEIGLSKSVVNGPVPGTYLLKIHGTTDTHWLVVETIKCSIHSGHAKSVLAAKLMSGTENLNVNYNYVADTQVGTETVSDIVRTYMMGATQLASQYKTPYGTVVP